MSYKITLGLVAAVFTTASFLPQVLLIIKTKETKNISLMMYVVLSIGVSLWLIYGILINDFPVIIANSITLALVLIVLVFKIKYK